MWLVPLSPRLVLTFTQRNDFCCGYLAFATNESLYLRITTKYKSSKLFWRILEDNKPINAKIEVRKLNSKNLSLFTDPLFSLKSPPSAGRIKILKKPGIKWALAQGGWGKIKQRLYTGQENLCVQFSPSQLYLICHTHSSNAMNSFPLSPLSFLPSKVCLLW